MPSKGKEKVEIPKSFYYEWKIREFLVSAGFSEVMTSSFAPLGDVEIEKPLAEDKRFARQNLQSNFEKALKLNVSNAPLFGSEDVRIFEIGKVFPVKGEHTGLILGLKHAKKQKRNESYVLEGLIQDIEKSLGIEIETKVKTSINYGVMFEANLDGAIQKLSESQKWDISIPVVQSKKFIAFSLYPLIVRDIALFVSLDTTPESVAKIIKENAGDLVVRGPELFDEFSKDGKKSLAFRLVFQSFDRTLSDEEVNKIMEKVYVALTIHGWQIR